MWTHVIAQTLDGLDGFDCVRARHERALQEANLSLVTAIAPDAAIVRADRDRELGRRSMILMAEKVMPHVNASASKAAE